MKFLLMMSFAGKSDYAFKDWAAKDVEAHMRFLEALNEELRAAGELVGIEALTSPTRAKLVRAGENGKPVTDGVFPETKEFLAGFWKIDVENEERAYAIAAKASNAPGANGVPLRLGIEVREIMRGPSGDLE